MKPTIERVACHESGHAIASIMHGFPFDEVTIKPSKSVGTHGHILHNELDSALLTLNMGSHSRVWRTAAREAVIGSLAGLAAEKVILGDTWEPGGASDLESAREIARYLSSDVDNYLGRMMREARALIRKCLTETKALIAKLLERKTLSWAEANDIFDTCSQ